MADHSEPPSTGHLLNVLAQQMVRMIADVEPPTESEDPIRSYRMARYAHMRELRDELGGVEESCRLLRRQVRTLERGQKDLDERVPA